MHEGVMTRRKSFFDEVEEMFERFKKLFEEQGKAYGLGGLRRNSSSMYSITITYDHYGRPVVKVSAQGDVDKSEIEKYVKERCPNAKIIWEGEDDRPHVRPIEDSHVREVSVQEYGDLKQTKRPRGSEIIELDSKKLRIYGMKIKEEDEKRKGWYDIKVD